MDFLSEVKAIDDSIFGSLGDQWKFAGVEVPAIPDTDYVNHQAGWGRRMQLVIQQKNLIYAVIGAPAENIAGEVWTIADTTPPIEGLVTVFLEVPNG